MKKLILIVCAGFLAVRVFGVEETRDLKGALQAAVHAGDWARVQKLAAQLERQEQSAPSRAKASDVSAASPKTKPDDSKSLIQKLKDNGFSLTRSPEANGGSKTAPDGKGASFSFTNDYNASAHPVFNADFYLKWKNPSWNWVHFYPQWVIEQSAALSVQGALSSGTSAADALKFRMENQWSFSNQAESNPFFEGGYLTFSAKDESDRDFKTNRLSAELVATPNILALWIGQYSGTDADSVQFRWRPYVGSDIGGYVCQKDEVHVSTLWLTGRLRADLRLNFLRKILELKDVVAYIDDTCVYLAEDDSGHNYLESGIDFDISETFGLTLQYTVGQKSPNFVSEKVLKGGFTVKF